MQLKPKEHPELWRCKLALAELFCRKKKRPPKKAASLFSIKTKLLKTNNQGSGKLYPRCSSGSYKFKVQFLSEAVMVRQPLILRTKLNRLVTRVLISLSCGGIQRCASFVSKLNEVSVRPWAKCVVFLHLPLTVSVLTIAVGGVCCSRPQAG